MSQEVEPSCSSSWLPTPQLWLRWWSTALNSTRESLHSLWLWLREDTSSPEDLRKRPGPQLALEVLEERNHPDDLGSVLGISIVGAMLGTVPDPTLRPLHGAIQQGSSTTPAQNFSQASSAPSTLANFLEHLQSNYPSTVAAPRDSGFPSALTRSEGGSSDVDPLIAKLLFDLEQFDARRKHLTAGPSGRSNQGSGASTTGSSDPGSSGSQLLSPGTPPATFEGSTTSDPFAWTNSSDVGAQPSTSSTTTTTSLVQPEGTLPPLPEAFGAGLEEALAAPALRAEQPGLEERGTVPATVAPDFGRLGVTFEKNVGQTDSEVQFLSRGVGQTLFLTSTEAVLSLAGPRTTEPGQPGDGEPGAGDHQARLNDVLRLSFVGSNPNPTVRGVQELDTRSNYFVGNDRSEWHSDIENYGAVQYEDLYQGVDLIWHPSELSSRQFQFDYRVQAGADPNQVAFKLEGARSLTVEEDGSLVVSLAQGDVRLLTPVLYQEQDGQRQQVQGSYRLLGDNQIGFEVGDYDRTRELTLDPTLNWSTYLGGDGDDFANDVFVDPAGNVYVVGSTASSNFPTSDQYRIEHDVVVLKLSPDGQNAIYSTYLGATERDIGYGITVDAAGAAYITGETNSADFPLLQAFDSTNPFGSPTYDAFITKLSSAGNAIVYSSYLGNDDGNETGYAIAVDPTGAAYVTGRTGVWFGSNDFPTVSAYQSTYGGGSSDAFLTKVDSSGSTVVYSTYFGGSSADVGRDIILTSEDEVVIAGWTSSTNLPTLGAIQGSNAGMTDAFVTKFASSGTSLNWSTYFGGSSVDVANGIDLDNDDNVYIVGTTESSNFPTANAYQSTPGSLYGGKDVFAAKWDSAGTTTVYSTYLGGSGEDEGQGIAVASDGSVWVTGSTSSGYNFPTTAGSLPYAGGSMMGFGSDAFVSHLSASGSSLLFSTYLGGEYDDYGLAIALDRENNPIVVGTTASTDFPTQDPLYGSNSGSYDAFVAKIQAAPIAAITTISTDSGVSGTDRITNDTTLILQGTATANATVTLYQEGLGILGTSVATSGGTWSYDYTGTSLTEGSKAFKVYATSSGISGVWSAPSLILIDTTAPTVTLTMDPATTSFAPAIQVTATDLVGIPATTTVTLDVDLDNDGNFTDPGETAYVTATMTTGLALFTLSPAMISTGIRGFRARLSDIAGNEGTSPLVTVSFDASTWSVDDATVFTDALQGDAAGLEGVLQTGHSLDLDQSPGSQGFGLVYTSHSANAQPIVAVRVQSDNSIALPPTITATLTWDTSGTPTTYSYAFDTTDYSPGDLFTLALQGPVVTTTGRYAWTMDVSADFMTPVTGSYSGSSFVVSRDASIFGAGWSFNGVDELIDIPADGSLPAGKLRVYGSGLWSFYEGTGTFTSPVGDSGTLAASGGGWLYTSATGEQTHFDSSGKQTRLVSADGLSTTTFTYSSGDLSEIRTPDGAVTTLTLSSGKVQTIQTGSRTYTLSHSSDDLTSVTNPDSAGNSFGYNGSHKLTSESFGVTQGTYAYDSYGLLSGITQGSGTDAIRTAITPVVKLGLYELYAGEERYATVLDGAGSTWRKELEEHGWLLKSLAPNGAEEKYVRDGNGRVTSVTDPIGRTTSYSRDAQGFVTQVTYADSTYQQYTYAANAYHSLLSVRDERGNVTSYTYDISGRNTGVEDALSNDTTLTYNGYGLVETVTDARNNTTTYAYDAYRRLTNTLYADGGVVSMGYDTNGNVAWQTDQRGHTTTFTNDVMGRTTRVDNPDGSYGTFTYDATGLNTGSRDRGGVISAINLNSRGQVASTAQGIGTGLYRSNLSQFDSLGRPSGSRDAMGYWTHASYNSVSQQTGSTDALGNTTGNVYDLAGQLIQYRNELGQVTQQVHDARGRVVETINSLTQRTTSTFDEAGNLTGYQDALGHRVTTTFDALNRAYQVQTSATQFNTTTFDEVGNVWTTTDAANKTTTFTYDVMNRQKTITNAANETTTFQYDLAGNTIAVTNARNQTTTSVYDSMNRVVETITSDNQRATIVYAVSGVVERTINALNQTATMLYDALNQAVGSINALGQTSSSLLDTLGRAVGSIDASGKVHTNWFDQIGNSIGGVDGLGNSTSNQFDAARNLIASTDANGNKTEYQYDSLNRRTVTIDPNGGRVTQTFDANGNLTTYTDPEDNTTTFVYDTQNREIQRTDALGHSLTYAYDARNLMTSQTDRLGRRKDWTYDDLGRVLTETWINADTSTANVLTFAYDANGNQTLAQDDDGTYTLTYDNQDRLETIDGLFGVSLTFQYDALSRQTWVEDSFGGVMSSTYDAAGRLEKRQFGGTGMATLTYERDYADNGEMLAARRYSDLSSTNLIGSTTYGYDAAYRLTNIQHKDGSGTNIAAYTMTFDAGGRITEENRNGTSVTYAYDTRSQLTQAGADGYSYDDNGNRTMAGYSTGGMNQLLNDGTFTYTYDLEGNVSTKSKGSGLETWFYGYDHNNRLLSVRKTSDGSTNTLTVTYSHDVFGNRVKEDKWSSGPGLVTTKFVYLGQEVYLDLDNSNVVLMRYIQGDTADEMIVRIDGGNNVAWFLTDRLGSVREIVDYTGALADSITYNGVGMVTAESTPGYMGNVGYTGMGYDSDTGLNTTPHRDYDPAVAKWLQQDPIWFQAGDPNIYRMVGNNFTNATDPSGMQAQPALTDVEKQTVPGLPRKLPTGRKLIENSSKLKDAVNIPFTGPTGKESKITVQFFQYVWENADPLTPQVGPDEVAISATVTGQPVKINWIQFHKTHLITKKNEEFPGAYTSQAGTYIPMVGKEDYPFLDAGKDPKRAYFDQNFRYTTDKRSWLAMVDPPSGAFLAARDDTMSAAWIEFDAYLCIHDQPVYRVHWEVKTTLKQIPGQNKNIDRYEVVEVWGARETQFHDKRLWEDTLSSGYTERGGKRVLIENPIPKAIRALWK